MITGVGGTSAANSNGYNAESGYASGTSYDMATGLGSVDVVRLLQYWSTVGVTSTSTTLTVGTLCHGDGLQRGRAVNHLRPA